MKTSNASTQPSSTLVEASIETSTTSMQVNGSFHWSFHHCRATLTRLAWKVARFSGNFHDFHVSSQCFKYFHDAFSTSMKTSSASLGAFRTLGDACHDRGGPLFFRGSSNLGAQDLSAKLIWRNIKLLPTGGKISWPRYTTMRIMLKRSRISDDSGLRFKEPRHSENLSHEKVLPLS